MMNKDHARQVLEAGHAFTHGLNAVSVRRRFDLDNCWFEVRYNGAPMEVYPSLREAIDNALLALDYPE